MLKGLQKGVLKHILGVLTIARDVHAEPVNFFFIAIDEFLKGRIVSRLRFADKLAFVTAHSRWRLFSHQSFQSNYSLRSTSNPTPLSPLPVDSSSPATP